MNRAKNQPIRPRNRYGRNFAPRNGSPRFKKNVSILFIIKKGDESP
jgi:hypothetical protein